MWWSVVRCTHIECIEELVYIPDVELHRLLVRQIEKLDVAVVALHLHLVWQGTKKLSVMVVVVTVVVVAAAAAAVVVVMAAAAAAAAAAAVVVVVVVAAVVAYVDVFDHRVYGFQLQFLELPLRVIERGGARVRRRIVVLVFALIAVGRVASVLSVELKRFEAHPLLLRVLQPLHRDLARDRLTHGKEESRWWQSVKS